MEKGKTKMKLKALTNEGHKIAKARDEWLISGAGRHCCAGSATSEYLKNRLVVAFIAGWEARGKTK